MLIGYPNALLHLFTVKTFDLPYIRVMQAEYI